MAKHVLVTFFGDANAVPLSAIADSLSRVGVTCSIADATSAVEDDYGWSDVSAAVAAERIASAWLIVGSAEQLASKRTRYLLSLAVARHHAEAQPALAPMLLCTSPSIPSLPFLLDQLEAWSVSDTRWPAQLVATLYGGRRAAPAEFCLAVHGGREVGQWFEVGPLAATWAGVLFGCTGDGTVDFIALGERGALPRTSTLEYPMRGIEFTAGGRDYVGWSVANHLRDTQSCYVRVRGCPGTLAFGPASGGESATLSIVSLD